MQQWQAAQRAGAFGAGVLPQGLGLDPAALAPAGASGFTGVSAPTPTSFSRSLPVYSRVSGVGSALHASASAAMGYGFAAGGYGAARSGALPAARPGTSESDRHTDSNSNAWELLSVRTSEGGSDFGMGPARGGGTRSNGLPSGPPSNLSSPPQSAAAYGARPPLSAAAASTGAAAPGFRGQTSPLRMPAGTGGSGAFAGSQGAHAWSAGAAGPQQQQHPRHRRLSMPADSGTGGASTQPHPPRYSAAGYLGHGSGGSGGAAFAAGTEYGGGAGDGGVYGLSDHEGVEAGDGGGDVENAWGIRDPRTLDLMLRRKRRMQGDKPPAAEQFGAYPHAFSGGGAGGGLGPGDASAASGGGGSREGPSSFVRRVRGEIAAAANAHRPPAVSPIHPGGRSPKGPGSPGAGDVYFRGDGGFTPSAPSYGRPGGGGSGAAAGGGAGASAAGSGSHGRRVSSVRYAGGGGGGGGTAEYDRLAASAFLPVEPQRAGGGRSAAPRQSNAAAWAGARGGGAPAAAVPTGPGSGGAGGFGVSGWAGLASPGGAKRKSTAAAPAGGGGPAGNMFGAPPRAAAAGGGGGRGMDAAVVGRGGLGSLLRFASHTARSTVKAAARQTVDPRAAQLKASAAAKNLRLLRQAMDNGANINLGALLGGRAPPAAKGGAGVTAGAGAGFGGPSAPLQRASIASPGPRRTSAAATAAGGMAAPSAAALAAAAAARSGKSNPWVGQHAASAAAGGPAGGAGPWGGAALPPTPTATGTASGTSGQRRAQSGPPHLATATGLPPLPHRY
jgi:hypothetical protein